MTPFLFIKQSANLFFTGFITNGGFRMQVNNISNTNFQGSFYIKHAAPELGAQIMKHTKEGRSIYQNVEKKGDLFVVARDKLDNKIKEYLNEKNIKFEFFPQLDTKEGSYFVTKVHELQPLIADLRITNGHRRRIPKNQIAERVAAANNKLGKNQSLVSRNENGDYTYIVGKPFVNKLKPVEQTVAPEIEKKVHVIKPIEKSENYIKNIAIAHNLDLNIPVKNIRGATIIEVPEINSKMIISKPDEMQRHYVMVKTKNMPNDRFVMNSEGKYLYSMNSNEDAEIFDSKFQNLLEPKS